MKTEHGSISMKVRRKSVVVSDRRPPLYFAKRQSHHGSVQAAGNPPTGHNALIKVQQLSHPAAGQRVETGAMTWSYVIHQSLADFPTISLLAQVKHVNTRANLLPASSRVPCSG